VPCWAGKGLEVIKDHFFSFSRRVSRRLWRHTPVTSPVVSPTSPCSSYAATASPLSLASTPSRTSVIKHIMYPPWNVTSDSLELPPFLSINPSPFSFSILVSLQLPLPFKTFSQLLHLELRTLCLASKTPLQVPCWAGKGLEVLKLRPTLQNHSLHQNLELIS
uniref:Uncharacterized protein n=1 Tax=Brassica oleracea var. oleracea TaxID=109376 RepID=A0A0D3DNV0_BRAOL